jgi:hypothetical protein
MISALISRAISASFLGAEKIGIPVPFCVVIAVVFGSSTRALLASWSSSTTVFLKHDISFVLILLKAL